MSRNSLLFLFVALLVVGSTFVLTTMASLPERVASSFGGNGQANDFMSRAGYRWFMLTLVVILPLFMVALLAGLPRLMPQYINLPNRDFWLAPERREETLAYLTQHALWLGCALVLFGCGLHWLVVQANTLTPPHLALGPFVGLLVVFFGVIGLWIMVLVRRFQIKE